MKTHSADRTRSWRQRAGSRRNKHIRNVGVHGSDYPKGWTRFYHCDDTFSHAINPSRSKFGWSR